MKPKKKILLVDESEDRRLELLFLLETHGYKVHPCVTAAQGMQVICGLPEYTISAVICFVDMGDLDKFEKACTFIPFYVISLEIESAELLESLKTMCKGKRGPKPVRVSALERMAA